MLAVGGTSCISLVSVAAADENSLTPLHRLLPTETASLGFGGSPVGDGDKNFHFTFFRHFHVWGWYHYPRAAVAVSEQPRAGFISAEKRLSQSGCSVPTNALFPPAHSAFSAFLHGGGITTLGVRCVVRNLCARSGQKSILCHLCMDRGNVGEKQRAFGTETRTVRVSVPRRRGPAGSRCSTAVSCAAPVSFAVRYHCDEGQRGKFVNVTVVILFVV